MRSIGGVVSIDHGAAKNVSDFPSFNPPDWSSGSPRKKPSWLYSRLCFVAGRARRARAI